MRGEAGHAFDLRLRRLPAAALMDDGRLLLAGRVRPARHPRARQADRRGHRRTRTTALKQRLARVQEIRAFASRELGLPDNASYTRTPTSAAVRRLERVRGAELSLSRANGASRSPAASTTAATSTSSEARAEAARLKAAGDDV